MVSSVVVLRFLHMSTIAPPLLAYLPWLLGTQCTVISTSMSTTLGYFTVFPFVALLMNMFLVSMISCFWCRDSMFLGVNDIMLSTAVATGGDVGRQTLDLLSTWPGLPGFAARRAWYQRGLPCPFCECKTRVGQACAG